MKCLRTLQINQPLTGGYILCLIRGTTECLQLRRGTRAISSAIRFVCIALPKSVDEASMLDSQNRTTYWMDALEKEMKNTKVAFKILEEGEMAPLDH